MESSGGRKFHKQFMYESKKASHECPNENDFDMLSYINRNILGKDQIFNGAFGDRKALYCDYTASGRSLKFIEDYISENVLPHYGNTHTTTSITSLQTTMFRQEARDLIRQAVNALENDVVIFTASGCTGAVHKLIHALNLKVPPIVLVGPYEHHSNLLPWKEIGSKIIWTKEEKDSSGIDFNHLEEVLQKVKKKEEKRPLIGCFAAASNITGHLVDVDTVSHLFHKYNGIVFFDYATAGPYVDINMNPTGSSTLKDVYKDAIFLSPHKFVGGPQTPGILVAKKSLFSNPVPFNGGGGTVFFVTENTHRYLKDIEMREEGGTPAIIESVRAGLVFQLKSAVGVPRIIERDGHILSLAEEKWSKVPNLILLGGGGGEGIKKLPIFSFLVKHEKSNRFLHHNYVSVLLNDLFGIQSRGGCACAGPYAQKLLGMSEDVALEIEKLLLEDQRLDRHHLRRHNESSDKEILRPGFTRLNLPYFFDDDEIDFVVEAVKLVAEKGWTLLPQYLFDPETGEWKHKDHKVFKDRKWLGSIKYTNEGMSYSKSSYEETTKSFKDILDEANRLFDTSIKTHCKFGDQTILFGEKGEKMRWFLLPCEAQDYLRGTATPASCKNYKPNFFPGVQTLNHSSGVEASFEKMNFHYCSCTPYRTEYTSRVAARLSSDETVSLGAEADIVNKIRTDFISRLQFDDEKHASEQTREKDQRSNGEDSNDSKTTIETNNAGDQCILLCKPVPKRTLNTAMANNADNVNKPDTNLRFHNPPKEIFKPAVEGIEEFQMIEDGDRVLLCLSGGKDSLSMLHIIRQYQFYAKKKNVSFEFGAMTVDPQSAGYDPSPLIGYCHSLGVEYHYEEQDIIGMASSLPVCESICSFCSRMKRGRIYKCARREKYNVIALGQHLDDIAESFLMSTFHNGYLRSMKANYTVTEGDLRVVRPLIYVREKNLRLFAEKVRLPVIPENCPACFEAPKERHRMKQLLAHQEVLFPNLFQSLRSALHPLISKSKTGLEKRDLRSDPDQDFQ